MSAQLEAAALRLLQAPRGERTAVAAQLANELGCSTATIYSRVKPFMPSSARKRRADAGESTLTREEARIIAAYIESTRRETGSGAAYLEDAIRHLRANGEIVAGRVDTSTGEFLPMSLSAIRRALRVHHFHPAQLAAASPASRLSSPHPNHCWQIDASVSRQFYLSDDGARIMDKRTYYRGKPENFAAITSQRIWRYAITDHASGCIELLYVQGAESASNFLAALIHAMTERPDGTMHGRPIHLMSDPGSSVTAQVTKNLCAALGTNLIVNEAGNARAKGQVEQANYLIETHFEANLKMRAPVTSIAEINRLAQQWARDFNATRVHTRTQETRRAAWGRITPDQLVRVPDVDALRQLANSNPKTCTVRDYMIRFGGRVYDVSDLPGGVLNGHQVQVVRNALDADNGTVRVLCKDEHGRDQHFLAPLIHRQAFNFLSTAAEIGTEFRAPQDTAADAARKELDRLAMDVATDKEAKAARKARRIPFGGRIDPTKALRETVIPEALPRAGRTLDVSSPTTVEPAPPPLIRPQYAARVLDSIELAQALRERVPGWSSVHFSAMAARWPNGAPEDQLDAIAKELCAPLLRAVP
ncbi:DDE-type integrase/transposase/recombinase [Leptolyngbya phage Lsp-JY19]